MCCKSKSQKDTDPDPIVKWFAKKNFENFGLMTWNHSKKDLVCLALKKSKYRKISKVQTGKVPFQQFWLSRENKMKNCGSTVSKMFFFLQLNINIYCLYTFSMFFISVFIFSFYIYVFKRPSKLLHSYR